jgi:class 3 adenylate cyclase/tetratricopeptide (TPR) repeat protein
MRSIEEWLASLGLAEYASRFAEHRIDFSILGDLTDRDLKDELGIVVLGDRRRLLRAIAELAKPASAIPQLPRAPEAGPRDQAERRQVTVMFSDLVGSTALSTGMDPEDLREVIAAYHKCVADIVRRFDGFLAQYLGDGVLVYFGYPQAHEDDAERAVRAGLELIQAVSALKTPVSLQTRIGIATGLVVVGDLMDSGNTPERGIVGETPNLAARLQGLAEPNMVAIAESTRKLLGNLFELQDLGMRELKGMAEPVRARAALRASSVESRFEALHTTGLTALVGRDEEVELLMRRWKQAKKGEGRVVLISGEPGIGKSRLTAALSEHMRTEPHARWRYFCSPHYQDSALYPFIIQLERASGFIRDDPVKIKLGKLRALLAPGMRDEDDIALVSELLSLPSDAADLNLSPQRRREKLFEALLTQLAAESRRRPVLMIFEDAHWIDPTSRELLDLMVDRVRQLRVLLAITFRPEFQPAWAGRSHVTSLVLNRLDECDGAALARELAGNTVLAADIVAEIIERTDGVPLFLEELTKAVLESTRQEGRVAAVMAKKSVAAVSVPEALHASLMARLDRLGAASKVGDTERAVDQWLKAGRHAAERLAHREAIRHYERGIAALSSLAEGSARDRREIELQLARGLSFFTSEGFVSVKAAEAYTRARKLAEQRGDSRQQFMALYGLWQSANGCGMIREGRRLSDKLLQLTAGQSDEGLHLQARHSAWATATFSGEPALAREHSDAGRRLYDPERHRFHHQYYGGHDPGVCAGSIGAFAHWLLGYPDKGLTIGNEALALAEHLAHPFSLEVALLWNAILRLDRGEPTIALQRLEAAEMLASEQRLGFMYEPRFVRGAALSTQGAFEEAAACLREGLASRLGAFLLRPYGLVCLAEAMARQGEHRAALAAARDGLKLQESTGYGQWDAELHRLEGVALLGLNRLEEGQAAIEEALRVAQRQKSKAYELRAAMSIAQLWGEQGRRTEARELLAPVYGWFTEGFGTTDLKNAKALLGALA